MAERLQKYLSAAGVASRRHAEVLIRQGRVTVNGEPSHVGMSVDDEDVVRVNGIIVGAQAKTYVMLNKPTGIVTTAKAQKGQTPVVDLVESDVRLYPVGRLDIETSGLLLMTNDGDLAHRLMHPSFGIDKTYNAMVSGSPDAAAVRQLCDGIELDDGITSPAKARVLQRTSTQTLVEIIIHEGRNRQVRRMFDAIGNPVLQLSRTQYGPLTMANLAPGKYRTLTDTELRRLLKAAGMSRPRQDR